ALDQSWDLQGAFNAEVRLFHIEPTSLTMEEQASLHARERIEILHQRAAGRRSQRLTRQLGPQTLQGFLGERQQREILRNIGVVIRPGRLGHSNELLQARQVGLGQLLYTFRPLLATVLQREMELFADYERGHIKLMH